METLEQTLNSLNRLNMLKDIPFCIKNNLNPKFELRPYQVEAFRRFRTYFENENLREYPSQTLFHMATGSGKTLIMAGNILYLYKMGYRNFLFFVNSSNIIDKTKENFTNPSSSKYLFNKEINIDGKIVKINQIDNFQFINNDSINICFTTIQALHSALNLPQENTITIDDFYGKRIVLLSDEAHHINADTKKIKNTEDETWETTVNRVFGANKYNIMLEFTATMDIKNNELIKSKYENKIIFDYDLKKFREDRYSKEVKILQSDLEPFERALLAIILSQYRMKIFNKYKYDIKPVVMFKSKTIKESEEFEKEFHSRLNRITGRDIMKILNIVDEKKDFIITTVKKYLESEMIDLDNFVLELKNDFNKEHTINVNKDIELIKNQFVLNSLEDSENRYRLIFAVNKLNEGWDVLNLFDIVRLYNTRDADHKKGKIGATTMSEAQLIGRGARYCPFDYDNRDEKYQRKFDEDVIHELKICEELYYHSQQNSRYIQELTVALKETGIVPSKVKQVELILKEEFIANDIYKRGAIYTNERRKIENLDVFSLDEKIRKRIYQVNLYLNYFETDDILADNLNSKKLEEKSKEKIIFLSELGQNVIRKALMKYTSFQFNILKKYFPNVKSITHFIESSNYLGAIKVRVKMPLEKEGKFTSNEKLMIAMKVLSYIDNKILLIEKRYEGTTTFKAQPINSKIRNKVKNITKISENGEGVSQRECSNEMKLDLSKKDWYVYTDNYGSDEEKYFVKYFDVMYDELKKIYKEVFLIRNDRELCIYSFEDGNRFEPDYILLLRKENNIETELYQVFIEPKGGHIKDKDMWKEEFLRSIKDKNLDIIKTLFETDKIVILGLPFYNKAFESEFDEEFKSLIK